jgi:DNA processing protein
VVVIEAARRSGSLITAAFAADQGREIFAAPGSPLDPRAEGANDLLRDGATFCTRAQDVLDVLARQTLPRDDFGFAEPEPPAGRPAPFWDELDLPGFEGAFVEPPAAPGPGDGGAAEIDAATADSETPEPAAPLARETIAARVVELLGPTPMPVDELVRAARAPARGVRAILFELELDGRLERHGADLVSKI